MPTGGAGRTRRKKGAEPLVNLAMRVPEHTRQTVNEVADALGISASQYIQRLIERDQQVREASSTTAKGTSTAA